MINKFIPTGGVINPTSTTINASIPNQIAVASAVIPKSRLSIIGKNIGIVSRIMLSESITQPKIRYVTNMTSKTRIGEKPEVEIQSARV